MPIFCIRLPKLTYQVIFLGCVFIISEFLFSHESSRFSRYSFISLVNCGIDDDGANILAKELTYFCVGKDYT